MRIRWRGLELPGRVVRDEAVSTKEYGRFIIEPFEQGFGTTIGNSLRRVLLSSLEGAAVTSIKIDGVAHEFANIEGVLEDVTDIVLNIKGIVLKLDGEGPRTMSLKRDSAGEVKAGDIKADPTITIVNSEHHLATLTANVPFHVEFTVNTGRGYAPAAENRWPDQDVSVIPVDSVFSPIRRVRYRTEDMRVGQRTNYDRLILEVWTKGTISPEDALVEAGMILRKHLNPFVMYHEMGEATTSRPPSSVEDRGSVDVALEDMLGKPVSVLNLSVRASNCLEAAKIHTLRDLVSKTEAELLRVRSFGKTSLDEVETKLTEINLSLGMKFGGDAEEDDSTNARNSTAEDRSSSEALSSSLRRSSGSSGTGSSGPMEVYTTRD